MSAQDDRFDRYGRFFYAFIFIVALLYIVSTTIDTESNGPFESLRSSLGGGEQSVTYKEWLSPVIYGVSILFVGIITVLLYRRGR